MYIYIIILVYLEFGIYFINFHFSLNFYLFLEHIEQRFVEDE